MLDPTPKVDVEKRLQTMMIIIVRMATERSGVEEERRVRQPYTKNQRAANVHNIRKELET